MNFFEHQTKARRSSKRLVFFFILAVIAIITALYAVGVAIGAGSGEIFLTRDPRTWWNPEIAIGVSVVALAIIGLGSLYKISQLKSGGSVVAESLGGRRITHDTTDLGEKRLLNVVEEMAIASGVPVPEVYVLDQEDSINAFAAGYTPDDAAVAVTRGTLDQLSRDELQGVIAHEFSHVLNGDMRLNIRLMGVLHGILVIAILGWWTLRVGGRGRRSAAIALFVGLAMLIIGYIGVFFGRLIKAAVSRSREFLADASAVQFTRNPKGISGALKKIGGLTGSAVSSPNAESASHLFFGNVATGLLSGSLMSTHPPLEERIARIDKDFRALATAPAASTPSAASATLGAAAAGLAAASAAPVKTGAAATAGAATAGLPAADPIRMDPKQIVEHVGAPTAAHVDYSRKVLALIPEEVKQAAYEPHSALALIYALLFDPDPEERSKQIEIMRQLAPPGIVEETIRLHGLLDKVDRRLRLPVADLAAPTLRHMPHKQYESFTLIVDHLIAADSKVTLFEFAIKKVLTRRLDSATKKVSRAPVRFGRLAPVLDDCNVLLSALAHVGHDTREDLNRAFRESAEVLVGQGRKLPAMLGRDVCTARTLDRALTRLDQASPAVKERVIAACAQSVLSDGVITAAEAEMLRAIADALECPIPPFLPTAGAPAR